jgi:uncharacterized membrane protein YecN with MAPEG domain
MSAAYVTVTALIFTVVAFAHVWRINKKWPVQIGPHSISMDASWYALIVAALLAVWGFAQFG